VIEMVRTGRVAMARGALSPRRAPPRPSPAAASDISGDISNCSV
jgi:hypothetical protein